MSASTPLNTTDTTTARFLAPETHQRAAAKGQEIELTGRAYSSQTRTVLVRPEFTEQSVWREALGPQAWLRVGVIDGPIDARDQWPAGSMRSTPHGPRSTTEFRPATHD